MTDSQIVSKINECFLMATRQLITWLGKRLPKLSKNWFTECVLENLTERQLATAREHGFSKLEDFDLAALLTVTDSNWYPMRSNEYLARAERDCVKSMKNIRNRWAHCGGILPSKDVIVEDVAIIIQFLEQLGTEKNFIDEVKRFKSMVKDEVTVVGPAPAAPVPGKANAVTNPDDINIMDQVYVLGEPGATGMVMKVEPIGENRKKYSVFINSRVSVYYTGQIAKKQENTVVSWMDIDSFQCYLTAYEINNPSAGSLYSLNAARIDFVPYQFRPALKLIKADQPRILIADSVGVGKTIEAGLIIKELEARKELNNIAIICPKPLVAERKWELEMMRFDEEFVPLNGPMLRQIISDTNRDGEWPFRYNRVIMPYSIFDKAAFEGEDDRRHHRYGLEKLDPAPHFDLVIVDEAHYIRNGSMEKEKAFAYKCTKYFCDHADAVVMLTATPLQTSDDDLYTLLHVLRPDLIIDKSTLNMLASPNAYITSAARLARAANEDWQGKVRAELQKVLITQWGNNVIRNNPVYQECFTLLDAGDGMTRDQRIKLISNIESLHSLNNFMNRTRRKDIQDFCIRTSSAPEIDFTPEQKELYTELLAFEYMALSTLHNAYNVNFMMTTIKRQASSCIFGLAPFIKDIVNRRLNELIDDDADFESLEGDSVAAFFKSHAEQIIQKAENLSGEDPKFDAVLKVIKEKNEEENNKIILFSTFRHTLGYLERRLKQEGVRVAQINGGTNDEDRCMLRDRFELPKSDENAIDILLFTEVGAEGLDYQFCNMMINYDIPWNPMKIEQRIGRIDRRGQKSDKVLIYNPLTKGTIDADIYHRCLDRIGIFERSIGDCDVILGDITREIKNVAESSALTDAEKREKLDQIADNEIRKIQELNKLEDDEKGLLGFNLSEYMMSKDIECWESTWINPKFIEKLVKKYLFEKLGKDKAILGETVNKTLRLSMDDKNVLLQDFRKLSSIRSSVKRNWEHFLKDGNQHHEITFDSDAAKENRKAFFITATHPLARQAAAHFATDAPKYISVRIAGNIVAKGKYPFEVYGWNFKEINNSRFQLKMICENENLVSELVNILQYGRSVVPNGKPNDALWNGLESIQFNLWEKAKQKHIEEMLQLINYKKETLRSNFENQRILLEQQISTAADQNIKRMRESELNTAKSRFESKIKELEESRTRIDILSSLLARGELTIE